MMSCNWPRCTDNTGGECYRACFSQPLGPIPSPRTLSVQVPLPSWGALTIVTVDEDCNVTIRANQPKPSPDTAS